MLKKMEEHKEFIQSDIYAVKGLILGVATLNVAALVGIIVWVLYRCSKQG